MAAWRWNLGRRVGERFAVAFATLLCLLFAGTLRDVAPRPPPPLAIPAPMLPPSDEARDAALSAIVVDETGGPRRGASVRVFAIREGRAYFAGDKVSGADGRARFVGLPRGEVWVLAYDAGRARASVRSVLGEGEREERLVLRPARALDVMVVDETERPMAGARIEVATADPLPYVARTGSDGGARLDRLGPPPYQVRASADGYDEVLRTQVAPGTSPLRIKLERLGALEVTVVDPDGKPAPDATVLAAGSGIWPARSAFTDAAGAVRIGGLRGGVFDLEARLGELVSQREVALPLRRGEVKEVRLVLEEGKRVLVTVTDGAGAGARPVPGASVVLVEEGLSAFPLEGRTSDKGVASLGPVARGPASVSARAAGFVPSSPVSVDAQAVEARVSLLRGGAIVGDVVDDRGFPVSGATIEVVGIDAEGMPIDESSAMTDFREERFERSMAGPLPLLPMGELGVMPGPLPDTPSSTTVVTTAPARGEPWVTRGDGAFRADPVPPGRVHAIVRHPAYVEVMSEEVTVLPGGVARLHVVLHQGGWIEGRVLEADRTPVAGARIELAASSGSAERVTHSTDDGSFTFPSAPDEVLLSVTRPEAPGDIIARVEVTVPDRDRKEIEIVLPRVRDTVSIHIADDRGYPVGRVEVRVASLDRSAPLRRTLFTSDDGDAALPDAVGLRLRVSLVRPGKAPHVEQVDRAPLKLDFVLGEAIRAHGTVTARDGRDRLGDAEVTLFTASGARHTRTDAEGAYEVGDLAPGRIRITVSHPTHAGAQKTATVGDDCDRPTDLGAIDLVESGDVEGVVLDASDQPIPGARIARDGAPTYLPLGPLPPGIALADREGRFTLGRLPEGPVRLEAYSADFGRGAVEGVEVRAGRTTEGVKIVLEGKPVTSEREPKGTGSVAVTLGERGRSVLVMMVPAGSEAEAAGIEPGDVLTSVNGKAVSSIEAARRGLTGPLSEDVVLELQRDDGETANGSLMLLVRRERVRR